MATPYITPDMLINAPTGISWSTIPNYDSTPDQQFAEQLNMCWRATHFINGYTGTVMRATIDTEEVLGPDYRLTIDTYNTGLARFIVSRWPVSSVVSAQYTASGTVPPQWTAIPLNQMFIQTPNFVTSGISSTGGTGSYAIMIGGGNLTWFAGRNGYRVQIQYVNGWAHAGIVENAAAGSTTLSVDDCAGMMVWDVSNTLTGISMWIYDGANTELVTVESTTATYGPGTVTLAAPTQFGHNGTAVESIVMSALPEDIQQAAILHASYQALVRGATAITVQAMPGSEQGGGGSHSTTILNDAQTLLDPYRRVL